MAATPTSDRQFCHSLERPRRILMMIKAGDPVDQTLQKITPYLTPGDIILDGGNSYFKDTIRREVSARHILVHYFGMGVSGGKEGARYGPSLMPGGAHAAYEQVAPILQAIAAKTDCGPCVTYVGPDGAGHFVKMVHNGIEYGDMQLIAEAYEKGITWQILGVIDPESGNPLVNMILDKAGQKGTGKWTAQVALDLSVPIPTIAAVITEPMLPGMKDERVIASRLIKSSANASYSGDKKELIQAVHDALYASKICSYAQGMSLIRAGSDEWKWDVNLREMARIWKGGCIIRARFLDTIMRAFERQPDLPNLLLDAEFMAWLLRVEGAWRKLIATVVQMGIPEIGTAHV